MGGNRRRPGLIVVSALVLLGVSLGFGGCGDGRPTQRPEEAALVKELRELAVFIETGEIEIERDPRGEPGPPELEGIARLEDDLLDADMVAFFQESADAESMAALRAEVESWPEVAQTEFYSPDNVPQRYIQMAPPEFNGYLPVWVADPRQVSAVAERIADMSSPTGIQGVSYGSGIMELDAVAAWLNEAISHADAKGDAAEEWLEQAPYWQYWIESV